MLQTPKYLLDSNICIFMLRGNKDVVDHIVAVGIDNCCISEITVAELYYGAECSNNPALNYMLINKLCKDIEIIPLYDTLREYAHQKAVLRKQGMLIDDFDLMIGCTSITYDYILVTDNVRHFNRLPVKIENWVTRR